jgi:formamidopyrimidine-DNA glycosylase
MPELPEVEVTRLSVKPIQGARIREVRLGKPLRWPLGVAPEFLIDTVAGEFQRRGKYLWLPLFRSGGSAAEGLLWHLGMSGSLTLGSALAPASKHDHFELVTDCGMLRLTDPRRFGAVVWSPGRDLSPARELLARLGPEPFDLSLTPADFHASLQARKVAIKPALLGGELIVGAGNIYASDALFEARIDPRTRCNRIGFERAERLLAAVRRVLAEAIAAGGSTLRDFRDASGGAGHYQAQARVYGREGQACPRCLAPIRRIVQGQRATYFCARCQRI